MNQDPCKLVKILSLALISILLNLNFSLLIGSNKKMKQPKFCQLDGSRLFSPKSKKGERLIILATNTLLGTHSVPGSVLSAPLGSFILMTNSMGDYYDYPHFTDDEGKA